MVASPQRTPGDKDDQSKVTRSVSVHKCKHKRRYCRVDGCKRVIKSQGVCQRHGAKPRPCKVLGCRKQAQGSFDGMCKAHFGKLKRGDRSDALTSSHDGALNASLGSMDSYAPSPLIEYLRDGHKTQPPAWHRYQERKVRGYLPLEAPSAPLEDWEREMVCTEALLLTGSITSGESFEYLAKAWGRAPGFHTTLMSATLQRYRSQSVPKMPQDPQEGILTASLGELSSFDWEDAELTDFSQAGISSDHVLCEL